MNPGHQGVVVQRGELRLDRLRFEVAVRSTAVRLTRTEFELLWILASENGRVFHRDELVDLVWGAAYSIHARAVDVHVTRIRHKLKAAAPELSFIETVWEVGYRLKVLKAVD